MHLERRSIFQRVDEKCLPNNKKIPNKKKSNPPLVNFVMIDDFKYPLYHFGSANYIHHNIDARLKMSIEFYHFAFYEFLIRYLSNIKLPALREKLKFVHRNLSVYLDEMSRRMYAELLLCECHIEESFNKNYFLINKHHSLKLILNKWKAFHQYQSWKYFSDETSFVEFGISIIEKKWIILTSDTQKEYQKLFFPHGVIFNSLTFQFTPILSSTIYS